MIHLYCGNGKGKTTAAVGLAIRGAGSGMKVYFYQFLKNGSSSEIEILKKTENIKVRCCKSCTKFVRQLNEKEKADVLSEHNLMLEEISAVIISKKAAMIILDEFIGAFNKGLLNHDMAKKLVMSCGKETELILTGRDPVDFFKNHADYHSEIKEIKHPFKSGITARKGIEY